MIILTGSSGFLGKVILESIQLVNLITLARSNSDIICDLSIEVPVLGRSKMVIHSVGKAHSVPKTKVEKQAFFDVNVKGTYNLLKGLEQNPPKSFVFVSSVAVYGLEYGVNINEGSPLLAKDPYGLSKIQAEHLVQQWCAKHNVICSILRLPLLVGSNPPGNLGAMIKAIDKGYYFNIGGGLAKKSMVLAKDVALLIPKVAEIGGIYNLTDGYHPNFDELSLAISKNKNKNKPYNLPTKVALCIGKCGDFLFGKAPIDSLKIKKMTSDLTFDDTKARIMLNWNPQLVIDYINSNKI